MVRGFLYGFRHEGDIPTNPAIGIRIHQSSRLTDVRQADYLPKEEVKEISIVSGARLAESQEVMQGKIGSLKPTEYSFIKDAPILGFKITSEDGDIRTVRGCFIKLGHDNEVREFVLIHEFGDSLRVETSCHQRCHLSVLFSHAFQSIV